MSRIFHFYDYAPELDRWTWFEAAREDVLDRIVKDALRLHWPEQRRLAHLPLNEAARARVIAAWHKWWREIGPSVRLAEILGVEPLSQMHPSTIRILLGVLRDPYGDTPPSGGDTPSGAVGAHS